MKRLKIFVIILAIIAAIIGGGVWIGSALLYEARGGGAHELQRPWRIAA